MDDSDGNKEGVRDVSKAYWPRDGTNAHVAQIARQKNHCRNPTEIKLGSKVADLDIVPGNQAAV